MKYYLILVVVVVKNLLSYIDESYQDGTIVEERRDNYMEEIKSGHERAGTIEVDTDM